MGVILRHSKSVPNVGSGPLPTGNAYDLWVSVTGTTVSLPDAQCLPDLPRRIQRHFDDVRDYWLDLARQIGASKRGGLTHVATGAAYINDFGLMLAWADLVDSLVRDEQRILVICDDPWLFRHLGRLKGVDAGAPPPIWSTAARLYLRGIAARLKLSLRLVGAATALRRTRVAARKGVSAILVYGHPQSDASGNDAYFGPLMSEIPELGRALHTDCMFRRARELCRDGRSFSLHAWGNPFMALSLVFLQWRLPRQFRREDEHWLLRRAAAHENSGGALAMTAWQCHCQDRWLAEMRPSNVAWPWENHPWERHFVRSAHRQNIATVGYQHAVIGRHQFNFSPMSNPDGPQSLPNTIMCNGAAYRAQLLGLGHSAERLKIGGAFRVRAESSAFHDPDGPIYIALSALRPISEQMLAIAAIPGLAKIRFIVKDHPLYPIAFSETDTLVRTSLTIPESAGLRAIVYSTGTTGLEGLLAGVPTFRFLPADRIAPDILPDGVKVPEHPIAEIEGVLLSPEPPEPLDWATIMAPVDLGVWRSTLAA